VQAALGAADIDRQQFDALHAKVAAVRRAAEEARAAAAAERQPAADQLAALGPPPAAGQPAELPDVARQRAQLVGDIASYDAMIKQCELVIARANGLDQDIIRVGGARLAALLLAREAPPLSLPVLAAAARELGEVLAAFAAAPGQWWKGSPFSALSPVSLAWLGLLTLVVLAVGWPLRNWLVRRYGHRREVTEPSYARRVLAALAEGVARGLLLAIGLLALAFVLLEEDIVTGLLAEMVAGVLVGITFFSLTAAIAAAALAPEAPSWRIVPFGAESSRTLARRITALAAAAAVALAIGIATYSLRHGARELVNLLSLGFDTLLAAITFSLLHHRLWRVDRESGSAGEEAAPSRLWPVFRFVIGMVLLAVPILALAGYANLARYVISRLVVTGVLVAVLLLLRTLMREVLTLLFASDRPLSLRARRALALSEQGSRLFAFWAEAALDLLLIVLGIGLTLRLWGVPDSVLGLWRGDALRGIVIGSIRISLADILLSILVFVAVWTITRLFQRLLNEKLLPQTRLEPGVRHSLSALIGYIGFVFAALFAISMLGLNLSNLAIIAGALSVGIGFGLQNIVNNFVSGLILLIERPVKVGDWVVVGQHEGFVTRISVRATEIETFRRASVIVPNSELLSGAVINWTHRDKYGRVDIKVGVAYGSDTGKVRDIMLACAREHGQILSWPAAHVLFTDFGDSALQFELRVFIGDVEQRSLVASDLHFAIDDAFRKAGIEMPFPQREVSVRNLEALAEALAAGGRKPASATAPLGRQPGDDGEAKAGEAEAPPA